MGVRIAARALATAFWRSLRRLLTVQAPASDQEAAVMRDQAQLLFFLCHLFAITGTLNCVFVAANFDMVSHPVMIANAVTIVMLYGGVLWIARCWRRTNNDLQFLRRAQLLFTGLGAAWGSIINLFALHGEVGQAALILGLASGVVSTPIISVPTAVAFGFFIPDAILSVIAVTFSMPHADPVAATAFLSFTLYSIGCIICTNWAFSGRSEARAALQREITTVSVFLREYEEGSPDWLWETNASGKLVSTGPNMLAASRMAISGITDSHLEDLLETVPGEDGLANQADRDLSDCLRNQTPFRDILTSYGIDADRRWISLTGHPLFDERGAFQGFRGIGRDVTERRQASDKIAFMAQHDGLTGLLNRKAFVARVQQISQEGRPFALALIDLDDFKGTNDSYGHQMGDSLLQCVAGRIQHEVRGGDICGRLGGDEFAVLLPDTDIDDGHATAHRIALALSERIGIDGITIMSGASLGVAAAPAGGMDVQRILMLADLALYKAKEQGKGSACRFEDWMEQEHRNRMLQEAELAYAIENGQIVVAYQPVVDITTGQVVAAEALVRWNHPLHGQIMPGAFVPAAERSDLIERLGEVVLRIACRQAVDWDRSIQVNVNLSPRQLSSGRFIGILAEVLEETRLPPQRLAIEVTETLLLDVTDKTTRQLRQIREMGVKLVLDDFGTGYSSLSYLHDVEVDGIKMDASFTRKLPARKVAAIYRMMARLAADLNIYVVAEGVEDAGQLQWLRQNGIHFAQGYLLGRPVEAPPARTVEYLI